ncbi:MAG: hypothetical protein ACREMW_14030 [Gemmatimonadales bacterium]
MDRMRIGRIAVPGVVVSAVWMCLVSVSAAGQTPAPTVSLGFGVDTSIAEVREIVRLTRAYLTHPDSSAPSTGLWSTRAPLDARTNDLAIQAYQGFPATIVGVTGTGPGDSVFIVKVLHATAGSTRISPLALQRFYAVRAIGTPYGWQLASPLPRLTQEWPRRDVGRVTFWYEPGQKQCPAKAQHAARFVDSVARLFDVSPPKHLDVYITSSTEAGERLLGLDFFPDGSGPGTGLGGRTLPAAGILFLGDPRVGEAYLHEFVHAVLGPTIRSGSAVFGEGVAVWLGGSHEKLLKTMYSLLAQYQSTYPEVSMAEVLRGDAPGGEDATTALYATSGLIIDAIYRQSGIRGLRRFAQVRGSPDDIIRTLPEYITGATGNIDRWWRDETKHLLSAHGAVADVEQPGTSVTE